MTASLIGVRACRPGIISSFSKSHNSPPSIIDAAKVLTRPGCGNPSAFPQCPSPPYPSFKGLAIHSSFSPLARPFLLRAAFFPSRYTKAIHPFSTFSRLQQKNNQNASSESSDENSGSTNKSTATQPSSLVRGTKKPDQEVILPDKLSNKEETANKGGLDDLRRLARLARPEVGPLAIAIVCLFVASSVGMLIPWSIGNIIDRASKLRSKKDKGEEESGEDDDLMFGVLTFNQYLVSLASVIVLAAGAHFGTVALLRTIGERVVARLRSKLYRQACSQEARFFDSNTIGDLISRLSFDTVVVGKSITQNLTTGLDSIFTIGVGLAVMTFLSPHLTGLLVLAAPPVAMGTIFYGNVLKSISKVNQRYLGSLTKTAEERLGNIKTAQAFVGEVQEVRRYNHQIRNMFTIGRKEGFVHATYDGSTQLVGDIAIMSVIVIGGGLVQADTLSVGELTSFMMYTWHTGHGLGRLSGFYSELMKGVGAASRLFELQDKRPELHSTVGKPVKSAQGVIKFDSVHFAYPTRPSVPIFRALDFEIASGSNVCVVAASGGGKTTVASLLLRFYTPTSGTVTIDGVDVSDMNVKSLRRKIGTVSQEPILFSGTVRENITYGKPGATEAEILDAAKRANCSFIETLPRGLDTQVGARGSQLSGGQKQRIAIARALLKDPDILILDEATSALDAESETLVNEAVGELLRGRTTTISIAHRLSTIQRSDLVIVLDAEGGVAEMGTYAELVADGNSHFSKLMERQLSN